MQINFNSFGGLEIYEVIFEIYIEDKLANKQTNNAGAKRNINGKFYSNNETNWLRPKTDEDKND